MPFDKARYPANWDEISTRIKERAGWKCEQCGAPHGAIILRSTENAGFYLIDDNDGWYTLPDGEPAEDWPNQEQFAESKLTQVVLTTHHIGVAKADGSPGDVHDKMDCRDENLTALCQRCHFIADLPSHIVSARKSRLEHKHQRIVEGGQLELFK